MSQMHDFTRQAINCDHIAMTYYVHFTLWILERSVIFQLIKISSDLIEKKIAKLFSIGTQTKWMWQCTLRLGAWVACVWTKKMENSCGCDNICNSCKNVKQAMRIFVPRVKEISTMMSRPLTMATRKSSLLMTSQLHDDFCWQRKQIERNMMLRIYTRRISRDADATTKAIVDWRSPQIQCSSSSQWIG